MVRKLLLAGMVAGAAACSGVDGVPPDVAGRAYEGRSGAAIVASLRNDPGVQAAALLRPVRCPAAARLRADFDLRLEDFAWGMARATRTGWAFEELARPLESTGALRRIETRLDNASRNGLAQNFGWNDRAAFWAATAMTLQGEGPWVGAPGSAREFEEKLLSAYGSWLVRSGDARSWSCFERALFEGTGGF